MRKIFICSICVVLCYSFPLQVFAADSAGKDNKAEGAGNDKKSVKVGNKPTFDASSINKVIKDFTDKIKADSKDSHGDARIAPSQYMVFAAQMERFYKYPDVELEVFVYRIWFKKLYDAAMGMCNVRRYENTALASNSKEPTEKYKEEYKKYFNDFKNLIVNKKKYEIPEDKIKEMQKKKKEAEDARKKRR